MIHVLGIRHHGPGSARSARKALAELQPDVILVEGPADAGPDIVRLAGHADMTPPVALLLYRDDRPRHAVYYPFAEFSPEWQAIQHGLEQGVPVRFMDLPQAIWMALEDRAQSAEDRAQNTDDRTQSTEDEPAARNEKEARVRSKAPNPKSPIEWDPLRRIAEAAGYSDSERWWESMVEQRRDSAGLFGGVLEMMAALREAAGQDDAGQPSAERRHIEVLREAHMRQSIRAAQREGYQRVAVVCGAWHAPALATLPSQAQDDDALRNLPRVAVTATWTPWTYGRLASGSGYGAGIASPGYYEHLWRFPDQVVARWMSRIAHLLRAEDLDASPASVIEAIRLADTLAALRGHPLPGLPELSEAARAVFCFGSDLPMTLIANRLIVGERLGRVPAETPTLPLRQDLQREQKRLRLPAEATPRNLDLDLRKPTDLARSHLLHRLNLLNIGWGELRSAPSGGKGTFHEIWTVQWQPALEIAVIEANVWGNTVPDAAAACAQATAQNLNDLPALTDLVGRALLADLPDAIEPMMARLQEAAALTSDIPHLIDALPPLANVLRYGNVRGTDDDRVWPVVDGLVTRICIGLAGACSALNDDAAQEMFDRLTRMDAAMTIISAEDNGAQANGERPLRDLWRDTLRRMTDQRGLHGLIAGRCARLLFDQGALPADETGRLMGLALSRANEPAQAAAWIDGFLRGSGLLLLHNETLWTILDAWVASLNGDAFTALLPLLRRTFSTFPAAERRQMGEQAKRERRDRGSEIEDSAGGDVDVERAKRVLPTLTMLLGLKEI